MQLDKKFEGLIDGLVEVEKKIAEAVREQSGAKPWSNFTDPKFQESGQQPSSKKETELKDKTFDREKIDEEYVKKRSDREAKSKEVVAPKIQGDYMAAFERDKRLQWRSRIRTFAHAFGRRAGNGQMNGPLRKNSVDFLSRTFIKSRERPTNGG